MEVKLDVERVRPCKIRMQKEGIPLYPTQIVKNLPPIPYFLLQREGNVGP